MPIEPRHGQRIPSGARLAKVLARLLAAMRRHAARELAAGRRPSFAAYQPVVAQAALPLLTHEWALGAEQARRRLRRRLRLQKPARKMFAAKAPAPLLPASALSVAWDVFRPEAHLAAQQLALQLAGHVAAAAQQAVRDEVSAALAAGRPVASAANALRPHFGADRAWAIALTESSRAMHQGQAEAARATGVVKGLKWLASSDACRVCQSLNGKEVAFGEAFLVDPKRGAYARVEHAPAHPHCLCTCVEVVDAGRRRGGFGARAVARPGA